jgi:cell division protein FtsB
MKKPYIINAKQIIVIGVLVLFVFLMMDLNSRVTTLVRLTDQHANVSEQVDALQSTKSTVLTQVAYATSDLSVDEWARVDGHLSKPGDHTIILIPPKDITPTPIVIPTATPEVVSNWQVWKALLLGE